MKNFLCLLAMVILMVATASAGSITYQWYGTGGITLYYGSDSVNTQSGWAKVTVTNDSGMNPLEVGNTYEAYCVDLLHMAANNNSKTANLRAWNLYGDNSTFFFRAQAASYLLDTYVDTYTTDKFKAALQMAIWEVLFEDYLPNGSAWSSVKNIGNFRWSTSDGFDPLTLGTLLTDAQSKASDYTGGAVWIRAYSEGNDSQDFGTKGQVPEPGTMMLLGLGLFGLGAVGVRRRNR